MVIQPFEEHWREYDEWYDKHRALYYSELVAVELASRGVPRPWLEVGVGTGRFATPLRVDVGVDPSEAMLRVAASRGLHVIRAYGEELPFPDKSFGGVLIIYTICFLDNPFQALREAFRVLANHGKLVLGFIPSDSDWSQFYKELAIKEHRFFKYAKFYTTFQVEELLRKAGFEPELYISTLIANKPGLLEVYEDPFIGLKRSAGFVVIRAQKANKM